MSVRAGQSLSGQAIVAGSIDNTPIGVTTPSTGAFTTLSATGAVALSPANANVVLSPTGTGVVTINPATAGTLNNVAIGGSTPLAGAFTTLSATGIATFTGGMRWGVRVVVAAGAITLTNADVVVVANKTVGAATVVNLPAGVANQVFVIKDGKGDANSNNLTVTPAAGTIDGAATYVMNVAYQSVTLVYSGTQWNVM